MRRMFSKNQIENLAEGKIASASIDYSQLKSESAIQTQNPVLPFFDEDGAASTLELGAADEGKVIGIDGEGFPTLIQPKKMSVVFEETEQGVFNVEVLNSECKAITRIEVNDNVGDHLIINIDLTGSSPDFTISGDYNSSQIEVRGYSAGDDTGNTFLEFTSQDFVSGEHISVRKCMVIDFFGLYEL